MAAAAVELRPLESPLNASTVHKPVGFGKLKTEASSNALDDKATITAATTVSLRSNLKRKREPPSDDKPAVRTTKTVSWAEEHALLQVRKFYKEKPALSVGNKLHMYFVDEEATAEEAADEVSDTKPAVSKSSSRRTIEVTCEWSLPARRQLTDELQQQLNDFGVQSQHRTAEAERQKRTFAFSNPVSGSLPPEPTGPLYQASSSDNTPCPAFPLDAPDATESNSAGEVMDTELDHVAEAEDSATPAHEKFVAARHKEQELYKKLAAGAADEDDDAASNSKASAKQTTNSNGAAAPGSSLMDTNGLSSILARAASSLTEATSAASPTNHLPQTSQHQPIYPQLNGAPTVNTQQQQPQHQPMYPQLNTASTPTNASPIPPTPQNALPNIPPAQFAAFLAANPHLPRPPGFVWPPPQQQVSPAAHQQQPTVQQQRIQAPQAQPAATQPVPPNGLMPPQPPSMPFVTPNMPQIPAAMLAMMPKPPPGSNLTQQQMMAGFMQFMQAQQAAKQAALNGSANAAPGNASPAPSVASQPHNAAAAAHPSRRSRFDVREQPDKSEASGENGTDVRDVRDLVERAEQRAQRHGREYKTKVCAFYSKSPEFCKLGDKCTFRHESGGAPSAERQKQSAPQGAMQPPGQPMPFRPTNNAQQPSPFQPSSGNAPAQPPQPPSFPFIQHQQPQPSQPTQQHQFQPHQHPPHLGMPQQPSQAPPAGWQPPSQPSPTTWQPSQPQQQPQPPPSAFNWQQQQQQASQPSYAQPQQQPPSMPSQQPYGAAPSTMPAHAPPQPAAPPGMSEFQRYLQQMQQQQGQQPQPPPFQQQQFAPPNQMQQQPPQQQQTYRAQNRAWDYSKMSQR